MRLDLIGVYEDMGPSKPRSISEALDGDVFGGVKLSSPFFRMREIVILDDDMP